MMSQRAAPMTAGVMTLRPTRDSGRVQERQLVGLLGGKKGKTKRL